MTRLLFLLTGLLLAISGIAQEATEQLPAEPSSQQKYMLYGMTALGVLLIGLGLRNTKLFKKK